MQLIHFWDVVLIPDARFNIMILIVYNLLVNYTLTETRCSVARVARKVDDVLLCELEPRERGKVDN